jgi:hypothetical protein
MKKREEIDLEMTKALWVIRSVELCTSFLHKALKDKKDAIDGKTNYIGIMIGTIIDEKSGERTKREIFKMKYTSETAEIARVEALCVSATIKASKYPDNVPELIKWLKTKIVLASEK